MACMKMVKAKVWIRLKGERCFVGATKPHPICVTSKGRGQVMKDGRPVRLEGDKWIYEAE